AGGVETGDTGQEVDHPRLHRLSRGREEIQVAQASLAHAVQHHPGTVSGEMGTSGRLPDGGAELCGGPFPARQADGPRPAAPSSRTLAVSANVRQTATASADRASALIRSTIDLKPLDRCGVRCSRNPNRLNSAMASAPRMSRAGLPE